MPQAETVEIPKRLPLVIVPSNRDETTAKDAKLVNCYCEKTETGEYWLYKRPGLLVNITKSGNGYGVFNWLGDIYAIFGNTVYKNGGAIAGTVDTTNGVYRFGSCLGATPRLQLGNGVKVYNYDAGGGLILINAAAFPAAFVKGWVYLDKTTYVMDTTTIISGSGLNDTVNWDGTNTINAFSEPDKAVGLAKQLVYVVAFKQWSAEVFYDASNATGSPLLPVQGAKINYGCVSGDSIQDIDGILLWLSTNKSSSVQVMAMDNLKVQTVSTKAIEKLLDKLDYTTVFSWQMKHDGHKFYVITSKVGNLTLAFDLSERMWHQWTDVNGNYFPIVASTYDSTFHHILQHETNGKLYYADSDYTNDDGSIITVDIYTPNFDGGTRRRKQMNFMEFIGDQTAGSELLVRKNDDDYDSTKWSNFRKVDLSKKRPFLTNNGTFVRRAHNFRHQKDTKFRIQAVELQIDLGVL